MVCNQCVEKQGRLITDQFLSNVQRSSPKITMRLTKMNPLGWTYLQQSPLFMYQPFRAIANRFRHRLVGHQTGWLDVVGPEHSLDFLQFGLAPHLKQRRSRSIEQRARNVDRFLLARLRSSCDAGWIDPYLSELLTDVDGWQIRLAHHGMIVHEGQTVVYVHIIVVLRRSWRTPDLENETIVVDFILPINRYSLCIPSQLYLRAFLHRCSVWKHKPRENEIPLKGWEWAISKNKRNAFSEL